MSMRRLFAAVLLVTVAVSLAACGGGAATDTGTAANAVAAPEVAVPAGTIDPNLDALSATQTVANEPFPQDPKSTPAAVLSRLGNKQPMLLFFYDDTQTITKDQRTEIDAVVKKYAGLIDLLSYDLNSGLPGGASEGDPEMQKVMETAGKIKVGFTPYMLFVDRYGRITGRFSGFADRGLLEREVLRASQ
jgi:hypothetical protein